MGDQQETFECAWCRDHALEPPEVYTMDIKHLGGHCEETKEPICDGCADAAAEGDED